MSKLIILAFIGSSSLFVGLSFFLNGDGASPQRPIKPITRRLTPIETAAIVFVYEGPSYLSRAADPRMKPVLYEILNDKALQNFVQGSVHIASVHANAIAILAYIGDADDARKLADRLKTEYTGVLTASEQEAVRVTFDALGIMSRRRIKEAGEILDAMLGREYWDGTDFRFFPENMKSVRRDRVEQIWMWLMIGHALSDRPGLEQKVASVLANTHSAEAKRELEGYIEPGRLRRIAAGSKAGEKRPITEEYLQGATNLYERHKKDLPPKAVELLEKIAAEPPLPQPDTPVTPLTRVEEIQWTAESFSVNAEGEIVRLQLVGKQATDPVLADLHLFPHLENLSISVAPITDKGLAAVAKLSTLKRLGLLGLEHITDPGIGRLSQLTGLEEIQLVKLQQVGDNALLTVGLLKNLKVVIIDRMNIGDRALRNLQALEKLERLEISNAPVSGSGLEALSELTNLKSIVLRGVPVTDEALDHLKEMKGLERITFGDTSSSSPRMQVSDKALDELRQALPQTKIVAGPRIP